MSSSSISSQLNFTKNNVVHPQYRLQQIVPQTGSADISITSSGGQYVQFAIPMDLVYNLSRSYLTFTMTPAAGGASTYNLTPKCVMAPINGIQFFNTKNLLLVDQRSLNVASKVFHMPLTSLEDSSSMDRYSGGGSRAGEFFRQSNSLNTDNNRFDNTDADVSYTEVQYFEAGGSNTATPVHYIKLPLNRILHSLFEVDKDLYFNSIMYLRINFEASSRIYWASASATDPTSSAAAYTGSVTISSATLYLAVESDNEIAEDLKNKVKSDSGLIVLTDFMRTDTQNIAGTSKSLESIVNRNDGMFLKRVYTGVLHNTTTSYTMYDTTNISGAKVTSFYTTLNSKRLQDYNITCANDDDYMLLKDRLKGSCILSANVYDYNWFWVDCWDEPTPFWARDGLNQNKIQGIDLSTSQSTNIQLTTPSANHNIYRFIVTGRAIKISKNGIELQ